MTAILENAEELAAAHPDTFDLLPREARENVPIHALVKIAIRQEDGSMGERFWTIVKERKAKSYVVAVDNELLTVDWPVGHLLTIEPEHIYQVML